MALPMASRGYLFLKYHASQSTANMREGAATHARTPHRPFPSAGEFNALWSAAWATPALRDFVPILSRSLARYKARRPLPADTPHPSLIGNSFALASVGGRPLRRLRGTTCMNERLKSAA